MGLNLSRGKPTKYYTSNRIASLMGSQDKKPEQVEKWLDIFNKNFGNTYTDMNDLSEKINFYNLKIQHRKTIARNGQKKYFKLFNELKTTKYIINYHLE